MDNAKISPAALLSSFPDEPIFNVKAVCMRTGITPATLRAWERRYGLPAPNRTRHGYRLYSERDVALLMWLIQQTENGVSIGQAVNQLANMLVNGIDPVVHRANEPTQPIQSGPRSPESISREMTNTLLALDERQADQLFNEASALYTLETTLISVLRAALHGVLALRRSGDAPITAERFALNYSRQRLLHMIQITPSALRTNSPVVTIGFPGEHNELDLLILGLLLRRAGWSVVHLGTELDPVMVQPALNGMHAGAVLYYVDQPENAVKLKDFVLPINRNGRPIWCVCAGQALSLSPTLAAQVPLAYLGADLRSIFTQVVTYLETNTGITQHLPRRAVSQYRAIRPIADE
ncbi:MAG: cobalamin-dependent protein [Anaerolineae bacterium]